MLQGADTEREAIERHQQNLQRSLGLVAKAGAWWYPTKTARGETWAMRTNPEFVELRTTRGSVLYLNAVQDFTVRYHNALLVGDSGILTGWKVHTEGYVYSVGLVRDPEAALLAWHWHPPDPLYTHSHVYAKDETLGNVGKLHLPTSRVFFEQVVGFLIVGLEVEATVEDWRTPLADVVANVRSAATWRGDRP